MPQKLRDFHRAASPKNLLRNYRPPVAELLRKALGRGYYLKNIRFRLFLRQEQFLFFHEVDIELMDAKEGWAFYMSLDDALKLDDVRSIIMYYQSGMTAPFYPEFKPLSFNQYLPGKER
jgi:hypothetical protein